MHAKPELLEKYKGKFNSAGRALNAAMTESMDENVGRILDKLKELNLMDNTLIVFTNDNGGQTVQSFADNYPLKGRKGEVYEGGIRVPMIMMWNGKIKPGTISNVPVTTLDLLPTFISASGDRPSRYPELQGSDLINLLNGPVSSASQERTFYWDIGYDNGAIRTGKWKMTFLPEKMPELYNLSDDIAEANNVYDQYPDIAKQLKEKFNSWKRTLPAPGWVPVGKSKQEEN
jgi:arylsulfatase A-like enzyme